MPAPLHGIGVLVTRPVHQCGGLCSLIEQSGGKPLRFPVLEIKPALDPAPMRDVLSRLKSFHIAIFVSANAVPPVFEALDGSFPEDVWVAAVGGSTGRVLEAHGRSPDLLPERNYNSEGLLALDAMNDVDGEDVVIFRGEEGRELLARTLAERGACVEQVAVYRRACPDADAQVLDTYRPDLDIVTVTSNESLDNLLGLAGEERREWLQSLPLVVLSERMAEHARSSGFASVHVTPGVGDAAIVKAVTLLAGARAQAGCDQSSDWLSDA